MHKVIPITNFRNEILKQLRLALHLGDDEATVLTQEILGIQVRQLEEEFTRPVDIFKLHALYNVYLQHARENGLARVPKFTSDIMMPHPRGLEYQEFIANHPNYAGLPWKRKGSGLIQWVATAKSDWGRKRLEFWQMKLQEMGKVGVSVSDPGIKKWLAQRIHPTGDHICLFTGRELKIAYVYPAPSKLDKINNLYGFQECYYDRTVYDLAQKCFDIDGCIQFNKIMGLTSSNFNRDHVIEELKRSLVIPEKRGVVSPGVMSNSPDRLDGFHSYNNDVRSIVDTGRSKENLARYAQDRRAYEHWSDGDWKQADRLYSHFRSHGVSPDHIGPISLGFAHRPEFQPMTRAENSAKGNRLSFGDVKKLVRSEESGETVISWHSVYVWDEFKMKVKCDGEAKILSSVLRANMHFVMILLSRLDEAGYSEYLKSLLNLHYSYADYHFFGLNTETGEFKSVVKVERTGKNQSNNAERRERIAFESLRSYRDVKIRNQRSWSNKSADEKLILLTKKGPDRSLDEIHLDVCAILKDLVDDARTLWESQIVITN